MIKHQICMHLNNNFKTSKRGFWNLNFDKFTARKCHLSEKDKLSPSKKNKKFDAKRLKSTNEHTSSN